METEGPHQPHYPERRLAPPRPHRRRLPAPQRRVTPLKVLLALVGAVLTVGLVGSAFVRPEWREGHLRLVPRFSLGEFFAELPGHLPWLAVFMVLSAAIIPLRAAQWGRTLPRPVPFAERYHLVGIGAFVHNVLPGKLGDVSRSFFLARTQRMAFVQALGSVAVCKLFEFAALMGLVALSLLGPFGEVMGRFADAARAAVAVCALLVVLVVVLARFSGPLAQRLEGQGRLPRVQVLLFNVSEGLGAARSARGMLGALLYSIGPVLAPALAYGLALRGLGIPGGVFAGAVVLGAIALGQALPGVPAGMGLYYFVTSWVARELGAEAQDAAAFSVLTHLATVLTMVAVGGVSVARRKLSWSELRRRAQVAGDAAQHLADTPDPEPARA
jgi:uncharacterized membrane protein YbhN (UPF0104 family)